MAKGRDVRKGEWSSAQVNVINSLHLLTAKPMIYLVNTSEKDYVSQENKWLPKINAWVQENNKGDRVIPLSVSLESKLVDMAPQEQAQYLNDLQIQSRLPSVILAGYKSLDLIHYYTCGQQEVRAWTVRVSLFFFYFVNFLY